MDLTFVIWVVLLAALLYFPTSNLIWVLSVRRLQRKEKRELSEAEREGQKNRARFLAVFLVLLFSYLFNLQLQGGFNG